MTENERIDNEFAYQPWQGSCRNLLNIEQCCRRPRGHEGDHACGWGSNRRRWSE